VHGKNQDDEHGALSANRLRWQPDRPLPPRRRSPAGIEAGLRRCLTVASQWQLIWWRFREHKVALLLGVLVLFI
jgi:hypothetical protein